MPQATFSAVAPYSLALSARAAASFSPERTTEEGGLRVVVRVDDRPLVIVLTQLSEEPPLLQVTAPAGAPLEQVRALAEWVVQSELDLHPFYDVAARHPVLRAITRELWGLKPLRPASIFEMVVTAITEQQISLVAAHRIRSRIIEQFGEQVDGLWAFPSPRALAKAGLNALVACGLSRRKAEYVHGLAQHVASGAVHLDAIKGMSDEEARDVLMRLRGLGPWSADYILVRGLGRMDKVPSDDLGVRTIVGKYLGDGGRMTAQQVEEALRPLAPFRGLAAFYLLAHFRLLSRRPV